MNIKFILGDTDDAPVYFSDVKNNQFFISIEGNLHQKIDEGSYQFIARWDGAPRAGFVRWLCRDFQIKRVLEHVTRVEFQ